MIRICIVASLTILATLVAVAQQPAHANSAIIATFEVQGEQFRVRVENEATIEQVRALEAGESTASIPNGRVLHGSDGNEPWSWHLDPNDIEMAEVAIELCDGTPSHVEDDLDYWVDTVQRFCPWTATLVDVEEVSESIGICIDPPGTFNPAQIGGACVNYETGKDQQLIIGRALLGGDYAPPGTLIEAYVRNQLCGQTTDGDPFELLVLGAGERAGCAEPGETVRFQVDGHAALEQLVWPEEPEGFDTLSLTSVDQHAWYWFERVPSVIERGMHIEAHAGATVCGEAFIQGEEAANGYFIPEDIRGFSKLVVAHQSLEGGCGINGGLIEFRVNGIRAETAVFWQPGVRRLNLLVQGDANCDFLVDSRDATLVLQVSAALVNSVPCHGDADRDHDIDAIDARHILEFTAGITNALPL